MRDVAQQGFHCSCMYTNRPFILVEQSCRTYYILHVGTYINMYVHSEPAHQFSPHKKSPASCFPIHSARSLPDTWTRAASRWRTWAPEMWTSLLEQSATWDGIYKPVVTKVRCNYRVPIGKQCAQICLQHCQVYLTFTIFVKHCWYYWLSGCVIHESKNYWKFVFKSIKITMQYMCIIHCLAIQHHRKSRWPYEIVSNFAQVGCLNTVLVYR
jgi:hypothetical protein